MFSVALFSDKHLNHALRHRPDKFHTMVSQPEIVSLPASPPLSKEFGSLTVFSAERVEAPPGSFAAGAAESKFAI